MYVMYQQEYDWPLKAYIWPGYDCMVSFPRLSVLVVKGLLGANSKFATDVGETVETRMQDSLILLHNPATQGGAIERACERARSGRSRRSKKHLSLRKHRQLESYDLPTEFQKYGIYKPLHDMWVAYVKDLLQNCGESMVQSRLLTADLHGAIIAVVDSKSPTHLGVQVWRKQGMPMSHFGVQGIMVRATEKTFGILTSNDEFRGVSAPCGTGGY